MADNMDLGPFMQNYVLNNPFQNLDSPAAADSLGPAAMTSLRGRHERRAPPRRRRAGLQSATAAVSPVHTPLPPPTVAQTAPVCDGEKTGCEAGGYTVDRKTGQPLDTPKAHVGSNTRYASLLKTLSVPPRHEETRAWLLDSYRHVAEYSGWVSADALLRHSQSVFPHMTSPILSRIMKVTFPHCRKVTNKNGYFYEGLIRRPEVAVYEDTRLLRAADFVRQNNNASYGAAATTFNVNAEDIANMVLWHYNDVKQEPGEPADVIPQNLLKGPRANIPSRTRSDSNSSGLSGAGSDELDLDCGPDPVLADDAEDADFRPQNEAQDLCARSSTYNTRRRRVDVSALRDDDSPTKRSRTDSDQSQDGLTPPPDSLSATPPPSGSARRKRAVTSRAPQYRRSPEGVVVKQEPGYDDVTADVMLPAGYTQPQLHVVEEGRVVGTVRGEGRIVEADPPITDEHLPAHAQRQVDDYQRAAHARSVAQLEERLRDAQREIARMRDMVDSRDRQLAELTADFFELSGSFVRLSERLKSVMSRDTASCS